MKNDLKSLKTDKLNISYFEIGNEHESENKRKATPKVEVELINGVPVKVENLCR